MPRLIFLVNFSKAECLECEENGDDDDEGKKQMKINLTSENDSH